MAQPKKSSKRPTKSARALHKKNSKIDKPSSIAATKTIESTRVTLPGVFAHSVASWVFLQSNRWLFVRLLLGFWVVLLLVVGISQQAQYQSNRDMAELYSSEVATGGAQKAFEISVLFVSFITGGQNLGLSETQQVIAGFIYLLLWLVVIWLIRQRLAGASVVVRDGLYNATSPLIASLAIGLLGLLQLLPLAVVLMIASVIIGATQSLLVTILTTIGLLLIAVGTLYFLVTTLFAGVIVTVPGTYPWAAFRSAKQLVKGLRAGLLGRLLWLGLVVLIIFSLGVALTITLDRLFGSGSTLFVTAMIQLIVLALGVYAVTYLYLLYRRVVDV